jgi:putative permease
MLNRIRRIKLLFFLISLVFFLVLVFWVKNLLVSLFLALVGFFLLKPFVDFLVRQGLSRLVSTLFPFLFFSLVFFGASLVIFPALGNQVDSLKAELPKYVEGTQKMLQSWESGVFSFLPVESKQRLGVELSQKVQRFAQSVFTDLPEILSNSLTVLFLAPFLCFFMLLDGKEFYRRMISTVPNAYFELSMYLQHQIMEQMGGFIRARLLESVIVGFVIWIGLGVIQFPYALILAVFAALMNLIPYLGPLIGIVPGVLIALVNQETNAVTSYIVFIYLLAQLLDALIIVPMVVARIVNLHPVTVVLVVMVGSQTMGILGMIISIPFASAVKIIYASIYQHITDGKPLA